MTHDITAYAAREEYGLIVQQEGKNQQVLAKYLRLLLNYQYGLSVMTAPKPGEGANLLLQHGREVRCVFVIQDQLLSQGAVSALSKRGGLPLFLLMPEKRQEEQYKHLSGVEKVFFCSWEKALGQSEGALKQVMPRVLKENGISDLSQEIDQLPYNLIKQRIEGRLRNIKTLPTLPEIALRIMRLVNDPETTTAQLEQVLGTDPAVMMKLLQIVQSPVFAGTVQRGNWSLSEVIVRLGMKRVGAIAQQIKMIYSLMRPEESDFDLRRFWEHSVSSGIIADKLYTKKLLRLQDSIEFNAYWIAALLHDIGKLALGFFFWDWFARILAYMEKRGGSFRNAEAQLSESVNHEYIGQLLLMHSQMDEEISTTVGMHHTLGKAPSDLICLVHMADNLCKDLGLGCFEGEGGEYSQVVLDRLGMKREGVEELKEKLGMETVEEIKDMVSQCL